MGSRLATLQKMDIFIESLKNTRYNVRYFILAMLTLHVVYNLFISLKDVDNCLFKIQVLVKREVHIVKA